MSPRLLVSPQAEKDLKRPEPSILLRIDKALLTLANDPYPFGTKALKYRKLVQFRVRVGDYRILYDVYRKNRIVYILRVGHRKDICK